MLLLLWLKEVLITTGSGLLHSHKLGLHLGFTCRKAFWAQIGQGQVSQGLLASWWTTFRLSMKLDTFSQGVPLTRSSPTLLVVGGSNQIRGGDL